MTEHGALELSFEAALSQLVEAEAEPDVRLVRMLSAPSHSEFEFWKSIWPEVDLERRRWIADGLLATAEASFEVEYKLLFQSLLDDEDAHIRALAVDGLWEVRDARLARKLIRLLASDADANVRARAAAGLGGYVLLGELDELPQELATKAVMVLIDAATDESEDIEVRRRATESAGYADLPEVKHMILDGIESNSEVLRAGALRAMGNSADEEWGPAIISWLAADRPQLRFEAARAAGELALRDAVPSLVALADGSDREIQHEAIWALGEIGGRQAATALERLAAHVSDPYLLGAVEEALAMVALVEGTLRLPGDDLGGLESPKNPWDDDVTVQLWPDD